MKKLLQIDGKKVAIHTEGNDQGKLLLMLHGWGGDKDSWNTLRDELKLQGVLDHYLAVSVDLPGFGESEEPEEAWQVLNYTQFIEKLLRELYLQFNLKGNFDLLVHSFGGRILLKLLSPDFQHQIVERPDRLVIVAASGIKPRRTLRLRVAAAAAKAGKVLLNLPVLKRLAPLSKKLLYKALKTHDYEKSSGVMRETFLKVIDEDLIENLNHIKNPTLIFWGKKDSYVPVKDGYLMHKKIPGSRIVVFPDGKHGIHKTKAHLISIEISKFLTSNHVG